MIGDGREHELIKVGFRAAEIQWLVFGFAFARRKECKRPTAEVAQSGKRPLAFLLDHFIGADQQRLRDGEAQRFGGLAVDDQFEFRRLLDG